MIERNDNSQPIVGTVVGEKAAKKRMPLEQEGALQEVGRFQLRRTLGRGAMGIVHEALDQESKVLVALKTLKNLAAEEIYQFKQEFRSLQDVVHPNLCSLYELMEQDGEWFIVMELVSGVDFLTYSTLTKGRNSAPDAGLCKPSRGTLVGWGGFHEKRLRTALQGVVQGLEAIHRAGKVHRDIKPSNVIVTQPGRAVILDFGFVLEREDTPERRLEIVGTPEYMAPDLLETARIGPTADCYSLGVMLYEALTGVLPFTGTPMDILMDKQLRTPEPPRAHNPDIPSDLDALCMELLRKDPTTRPDARAILHRLQVDEPQGPGPRLSGAPFDPLTQVSCFVGREHELGELQRAFEKTLSGSGALDIFKA
ncbi:MAG: serine/threonine protein kinase [Myxococcota bacterium]|nr:serine/threonine protein kinase [Myxococcota bacterium]